MPGHHRRNGDLERIWGVERSSAGIAIEQRLDPQFNGGGQCTEIDSEISGEGARHHTAPRFNGRTSREQTIDAVRR